MHAEAYEFVREVARSRGPFESVVEIGGRDVNGSVRPLFDHARYVSLDIREGPGVDVVADAEFWEPDEPADCVVCCEVLEHAPNAIDLVQCPRFWLRPGGILIVTCATDPRLPHSAVDGELIQPGDEFYHNVSPAEFRDWSFGYAHVALQTDKAHGDLYAVATR